MRLGMCVDGRALVYDQTRYEFKIAGVLVTYEEVLYLDDCARIRWSALEQRDWFRRIDRTELQRCQREAMVSIAESDDLTPEEQVVFDAARNDGVLAGRLVQADDALVQAVIDRLQDSGLASSVGGQNPTGEGSQSILSDRPANPLALMELPEGMEALSQFERIGGSGRSMTRQERRLMKRILRNDDKAKRRKERGETMRSPDQKQGTRDEGSLG